MRVLPEAFIQRMKDQLGDDAEQFFNALEQPPSISIRLHHQRGKSSFEASEQVPWCHDGFYLDERPAFYLDPHWHGGAYYVQEASSMILDHVLAQLPLHDEAKIWVDMCAAPGGKTGILAKHLKPADVLVANEVIGTRRSILRENLTKAGLLNTFIAGESIASFPDSFADVILVDAPCAGEGMMRKEQEAINQWNQALVDSCSLLQKQIVQGAAKALKPDGYLIYSTCSYSMEENLHNIRYFQEHFQLSSFPLHFPPAWGIVKMEGDHAFGYQLYPHQLKGEGLFIAVLKKSSEQTNAYKKTKKPFRIFEPLPEWLKVHVARAETLAVHRNSAQNEVIDLQAMEKANELLMYLPRASCIHATGELKGRDFVPAHPLATGGFHGEAYAIIAVDLNTALDYLERDAGTLPSVPHRGWYLIQYDGTNLGWAKWTGQGWKNHYPMPWRLRDRNKK